MLFGQICQGLKVAKEPAFLVARECNKIDKVKPTIYLKRQNSNLFKIILQFKEIRRGIFNY
jgi:hypothetical protein